MFKSLCTSLDQMTQKFYVKRSIQKVDNYNQFPTSIPTLTYAKFTLRFFVKITSSKPSTQLVQHLFQHHVHHQCQH